MCNILYIPTGKILTAPLFASFEEFKVFLNLITAYVWRNKSTFSMGLPGYEEFIYHYHQLLSVPHTHHVASKLLHIEDILCIECHTYSSLMEEISKIDIDEFLELPYEDTSYDKV